MKELHFPEIILFHGCPTILNGLALEFGFLFLLGKKCHFLAEDFTFFTFV